MVQETGSFETFGDGLSSNVSGQFMATRADPLPDDLIHNEGPAEDDLTPLQQILDKYKDNQKENRSLQHMIEQHMDNRNKQLEALQHQLELEQWNHNKQLEALQHQLQLEQRNHHEALERQHTLEPQIRQLTEELKKERDKATEYKKAIKAASD